MSSTIVALATPNGRSGIGVVRLSGADSLTIARLLTGTDKFVPNPRTTSLRQLIDPSTGEVIDEAVITYYRSPQSFTGEDVVEISCHGSPVLLRQVIDICLANGARMADPGEFTLRALANGRMDLAEAEAVRDLIDAQSMSAARQAVRQLRGEFSKQLQPLKDDLLNVIVVLESALEFVEDDLPETQVDSVRTRLIAVREKAAKIAGTFTSGRLLREGLRVAIVGRPNVGKSSLFNSLLGSERAIVTEIPGTTRDQLHERFTVDGMPISLIDTAGLRDTTDVVESIGVERARATMADADIVIAMLDASEPLSDDDREILKSLEDLEHLVAVNKIDLVSDARVAAMRQQLNGHEARAVAISVKTGAGLAELLAALVGKHASADLSGSGFLVTDARHHDLLTRAVADIDRSVDRWREGLSEEIVLVGLHNALRYLGEITGETTTEDMLTRIFSTFCIGK